MPDTLQIAIPAGEWTQINSDLIGTVSNFGERDIHLRESILEPDASEEGGFVLRPSANEPFSLEDTFNLWARPKPADSPDLANTNVFVSTGINPIMDAIIRDSFLASFETSDRGVTALGVFVQDQTTQTFSLPVTQDIDTTTLDGAATRDSRFFDVAAGEGIKATAGNLIEIGSASAFIQARVLAVVIDNIEIDSPLTDAFASGSAVVIKTDDLKVDGSSTPQMFALSPEAAQNGDVTRLIIRMEATATMDSGTLGPLAQLLNGIVIRTKDEDGNFDNIMNFKTNGDFIAECFDHDFLPNNGNNVRLFVARLTWAGQSKHGASKRIDGAVGDELQVIVQDNLIDPTLINFTVKLQGHEVQE